MIYARTPTPTPTPTRAEDALPLAAADLGARVAAGEAPGLGVDTPVSLRREGPYEPLGRALAMWPALRDELAGGIPIPSLRGITRVRLAVLAAAALPMAALLELDRELLWARGGAQIGGGRVFVDLLLIAAVVFETTRLTPRMPAVAAVALAAIALRWGLVAARLCGTPRGPNPIVYVAATLSVIAAVALVRLPSRRRVALELAGKLGISRTALLEASAPLEPPIALLPAAVACAAGLPALLYSCRMLGLGLGPQGALLVVFGAGAPILARRFAGDTGGEEARGARLTTASGLRALWGVAVGLALAASAITAARLFFDSGTEIARCVGRLDVETRIARAAESAELLRAVASVRASSLLVLATTTLFPFAEERIYRGLLQEVVTRKYGPAYGIFAASLAFGLAHAGIYHVALYQTVLLGIGFGLAYAEGGLLAAFVVHATWNLIQLS